jgi:hypothetical protein
VIDSERDYQDRKWGLGKKDLREVATWLTYMRDYLAEAERLVSRNTPETVALDAIRKVTVLGMSCMEEHGAPFRETGAGLG